MSTQPFFIGPTDGGMINAREPWLLPDQAFVSLNNCYQYRGRVQRKEGCENLGRLITLTTHDFNTGLVAGNTSYSSSLAAVIDPDMVTLILYDTGAATLYTFTDDGSGHLSAGAGTGGSITYTTGAFTITFPAIGAPVTAWHLLVYYHVPGVYLTTPIMGLVSLETTDINQNKLIAFDTTKANIYDLSLLEFIDISFNTSGAPITWTGKDYDFFWGWNYYNDASGNKLLWTTNNIYADKIRYYNGVTAIPGTVGGWTVFNPCLNGVLASRYLDTSRLIITYHGRLLFLNTQETDGGVPKTYEQRVRWSQLGSPLQADAFDDTTPGKGGYLDASTAEAIVSCGFYKDNLIVFFER